MTREELVALFGATRNGWEMKYGVTSAYLAKAIVSGAITEDEVRAYVAQGYPEDLARALAHKASLGFGRDEERHLPEGGLSYFAGGDDVQVSINALCSIVAGDVSVEDGGMAFHEDDLGPSGYAILDVIEALKVHGATITQAAQLFVDGDKDWHANVLDNRI